MLQPSVGNKLGSCACIFYKTIFNKGIKVDQVEICVAAICAKQDGLMWLQLLIGCCCFFKKDKNIGQVEVCVAAICAKQAGLMSMHLFKK